MSITVILIFSATSKVNDPIVLVSNWCHTAVFPFCRQQTMRVYCMFDLSAQDSYHALLFVCVREREGEGGFSGARESVLC